MNQERLTKLNRQILAHGYDLFLPVDDDPAIIIPTLEAMKARDAGLLKERIFDWSDEQGYTDAFQRACAICTRCLTGPCGTSDDSLTYY